MKSTISQDYSSPAIYDKVAFAREFAREFRDSGKWNASAVPNAQLFLAMIEKRSDITDLRWSAYILATTLWETTSPHRVERPVRNREGKILKDKHGRAIMVKRIHWTYTMAPVVEVGRDKGQQYHEPVKTKRLQDGSVRITEHDGDQFVVTSVGVIKPLTKGAKLGARDGARAASAYNKDDGVEQVYFGRGYVQLTWWSNYAKAGIAIGRGLDLLLKPDTVKTPQIAFDIMAHGMITGRGFANGHSLAQYIQGSRCDYVGARAIVNGSDHAGEIAGVAKKTETALLNSRLGTPGDKSRHSPNPVKTP